MIDLQDVKVKNTEDWDSICPFPVGFVYMSTSKTSPATTYGGQWTNLAENRFPRFIATSYAALGKEAAVDIAILLIWARTVVNKRYTLTTMVIGAITILV